MLFQNLDETTYRRVTIEYGRATFTENDQWSTGTRQTIPQQWLDAGPEVDLREVMDPQAGGAHHSDGLLRRAAHALLVSGDQFSLWVFLHSQDGQPWVLDRYGVTGRSVGNQPLGPLADLQVYATDPYGRYEGKSHGLCVHERYLTSEHDLLTLREFVPLYLQDPGHGDWTGSGWCSKCAGYAIRRLSEEQFAHYWASVQAADAAWRSRGR